MVKNGTVTGTATDMPAPGNRAPVVVTNLDELKPYTVNVSIEVPGPDGTLETKLIPLKTIPFPEWLAIRNQVADPPIPVSGIDKFDRPIYNRNDSGYLTAQANVQTERNYRCLLRMLALPIPGETDDEKLDYLHSLDTSMTRQLFIGIRALAEIGEAAIQQQADTFRADGNGRTVDTVEAADSEG